MMLVMKSRLYSRKNIIRFWLPLVHFIASFFFEESLISFNLDRNIVAAVAEADVMSLNAERVLGYIIAKFFAGIMIYLLWTLIYYVVDHFLKVRSIRMFCLIFVVGIAVLAFCWPDSFTRSSDNLITYSYALRFFPEYWHSAYTSLVYLACMMVFPSPFSINVMQWLMFVFCIAYVYTRLKNNEKLGQDAKWIVFLIFLIPDTFILMSDSYRTELYALVCMYFVSLIVLDMIEGKKRNILDRMWLLPLAAFISVWRTEGLILGFLGFMAILFYNSKLNKRRIVLYIAGFFVAFILISLPQKLGDKKYYGSDYTIINSFATLRNIFNREDSNLSYDGADEDMAAIEAVVPIDAIRLWGMEGYRKYNSMNGHPDMNQSVADAEAGKAYVKAFYRLVLHNPKAYALTQISMIKTALSLAPMDYIEKIHGDFSLTQEYPDYTYEAWDIGRNDLLSAPGAMDWFANPIRQEGFGILTRLHNVFYNFPKKIYLHSIILILLVLFEFYVFVRELIRAIKSRSLKGFGLGFIAFALLLQAAAIAMVMPAGVLSYFRAFLCGTFVLDITYIVEHVGKKTEG